MQFHLQLNILLVETCFVENPCQFGMFGCFGSRIFVFEPHDRLLTWRGHACRGTVTALCDICQAHRPAADVVEVSEPQLQKSGVLAGGVLQSGGLASCAPPPPLCGKAGSHQALQAMTDGDSDSMHDTHAFGSAEERDSGGEEPRVGRGQPFGSLADGGFDFDAPSDCLLYTSPSPRD